jgi:hypothetical protein
MMQIKQVRNCLINKLASFDRKLQKYWKIKGVIEEINQHRFFVCVVDGGHQSSQISDLNSKN